ncbi:MAG: ABC transporter permease [Gemmatimonadota bacterium]|nr:ABC transporter permease [Gemmatimonadota bacterium]
MTLPDGSRIGFGDRVFLLLLKLYPAEFRQRFGPDLLAFFRLDRERTLRQSKIVGPLRFWVITVTDTIGAALRAHVHKVRTTQSLQPSEIGKNRRARILWLNRLWVSIPSMVWDLRFAFRSLRKSPWFVVVSVVSLGLAMGLTNTTFAVLDAVKNPYTPMKHADRVFRVAQWGDGANGQVTSMQKFEPLENQTYFHDDIALASVRLDWFEADFGVEQGTVAFVSPNFFAMIGVEPFMGRFSEVSDEQSVVVSFELWRRLFDGTDLHDAILRIGEEFYQVVGVMPRGMSLRRDAWVIQPRSAFVTQPFLPFVRLRPGVTLDMAHRNIEPALAKLRADFGVGKRDFQYILSSVLPDARPYREFHFAMGAAATAVLLLACANLANLSLARGFARRRELAVRMAIGASRAAVMRQMLAEGTAIAVGGGVLGIFATMWGIDLLTYKLTQEVRWIGGMEPYLNWRVAAFAFSVIAITVVLSSLIPAFLSSRVDVSEPLKDGSSSATEKIKGRYNRLVMAEVAIAMVLVLGTGLLWKAADRVGDFDFGYDPEGLLRLNLNSWETDVDYRELLAKLQGAEGVESASLLRMFATSRALVTSDVADGDSIGQMLTRAVNLVSSDFFETLGVKVTSGRDFSPGDAEGGSVIVERAAAKLLWPDGQAVGHMVKLGPFDEDGRWYPVVGIVDDVFLGFPRDPDLPPEPKIYVVSDDISLVRPWFVVRVSESHPEMWVTLQRMLMDAVPGRSYVWVSQWGFQFNLEVVQRQFLVAMFGLLSVFGLILSSVGLYSVLAYTVVRRTREFGIRIALGAETKDVARHVFHDAFVMLLAGIGIGAFLAMWSGQIFGKWLYDVHPADATALIVSELVLLTGSCLACLAPVIRATRSDPMDVLRAS